MEELIIQNVYLDGSKVNLRIKGNRFTEITQNDIQAETSSATTIDGHGGFAILPPFYNTHCHAAMTLFRGYADDLQLFDWLNNHIWPAESKLNPEITYAGIRLAILEMIKSGTVFFNDMYWCPRQTVRAVTEMGTRACVGVLCNTAENRAFSGMLNYEWMFDNYKDFSDRIVMAKSPHAIYSTTEEQFRISAEESEKYGIFLHTHLAETEKEFMDCINSRNMTPVRYLDSCGMLTPKTCLAHSCFLTDNDIELLIERDCVISHCPSSNMKLASGSFRYDSERLLQHVRWTLGTDGASSNNSLSMFQEMKTASLRAKDTTGNPTCLPAEKVLNAVTRTAAEAFGFDAGVIEVGKLADCILVDLTNPSLVPGFHLASDIVYSADASCVDTMICNGEIIMRNHHVKHEEEIVEEARLATKKLLALVAGEK